MHSIELGNAIRKVTDEINHFKSDHVIKGQCFNRIVEAQIELLKIAAKDLGYDIEKYIETGDAEKSRINPA